MKNKFLNLIYTLSLILFFSCNDKINLTESFEDEDSIYKPSYMNSLSMEEISKLIDGYDLEVNEKKGLHGDITKGDTVSINLPGLFKTTPDKRLFNYYVPKNLGNNYKIIFEFHGNTTSKNAMDFLSTYPVWSKICDTTNTIIISPQGSIVAGSNPPNYGWYLANNDPFYFDILVELFKQQIKNKKGFDMDEKSIFVTGHSSGGIFAWQMAYWRADKIAASVPRFANSTINNNIIISNKKNYKVPIRIIGGKNDPSVSYTGVEKNIDNWVKHILDINGEPVLDTIPDYHVLTTNAGKKYVDVLARKKYKGLDGSILEYHLFRDAQHGTFMGAPINSDVFLLDIYNFMIQNKRKQ